MSPTHDGRPAPALPDPPVGSAAPAGMDDTALATELQALDEFQREHAHSPGIFRLAADTIAPRRGALNRERTRRERERRDAAKAAAERERLRARQARTAIGQRNEEGRYPVAVDGRERGQVWRAGSGRDWWYQVDGGKRYLTTSRWEAADAVVCTVDARTEAAAAQRRREEPPAGWVVAPGGEVLERLDVVRLPGPDHGPAWSRPWRVGRREEHPGGRVSYCLEPADVDRPQEGYVLFAENLRRFARPAPATLAALPLAPFRVLHAEEYSERRLLNVSDELSSLSDVDGCSESARRALELLGAVEGGCSADPAADMRKVAALAWELLRIVTDPQSRHWDSWWYDRGNAQHAVRWATRAAERFEEGGGALTKEYRRWLHS
ncbi:hypothetical protein ACGF12_30405 [Kitasatospora sp. NPDC048296]|uniref:hypothetical protein n=1 Tax=Kitasatospora sp. NPDC048296 TaxID=3364048 RepID=UPI0037141957